MLPLVHDTIVRKKNWMTDEEMVDCLAVSQSIPGAVIINTATFVGRKIKRFPGSLAATLGVILPSFICIIILVSILDVVGTNQYIEGFFKGALSAAAGLVSVALVRMGKLVYSGPMDVIIAAVVFILVIFFDINIVWIIICSIPLGFAIYHVRKILAARKQVKSDD